MDAREQHEVIVIGAGAAGLGVAVELQRRGDRRRDRARASRRRRLELARALRRPAPEHGAGLSGLPREPIPRSAGTWPSREAFISYLEDVAERKRLDVRLGVEVERIDRGDGHWTLLTSSGSLHARFVVVATGYDRVPRVPDWPGRDTFTGELLHGSAFRNADPYRGRDVLVVGAGNTGTEIATRLVDACRTGARVVPHSGEHHAAAVPRDADTAARPDERELAGVARGPDGLPDAAPRLGRPLADTACRARRTASPRSCG